MDHRQRFLTNSTYQGIWNEQTNTMNGYGRYVYPDGSEYRGYFKNGKFHGYGRLRLAPPYKFIFKGFFANGKLQDIEDMWFADGLHVKGEIEDGGLNLDQWKYCKDRDRRYSTEISEGLHPVGPLSYLTRQDPPRKIIYPGAYDTEEGIYKPKSGFVMKRLPPLGWFTFIGCKKEDDWIKRNCRKNPLEGESLEPNSHTSHKIIQNNIKSDLSVEEGTAGCVYNNRANPRYYVPDLCKTHLRGKHGRTSLGATSDSTKSYPAMLGSSSCSSFSGQELKEDVENTFLKVEDERNPLGENPSKDATFLMEVRPSSVYFSISDL